MLVFLHGLESGPHGSKYKALKAAFGHVIAPDFERMLDVDIRLAQAEKATRGMTGLVLVGSSFGGLVAAVLTHRYPHKVKGYLLMAPALHDKWPGTVAEITTVPTFAHIIHGIQDDIVPLSASQAFSAKFNVPIDIVDDGHRLQGSHDLMVKRVADLLAC